MYIFSCLPDCWRVSSVFLVCKNVEENSVAKNCDIFSFLSADSKIFEKPVNSSFVDHLRKCDLFSDFLYGFRSSALTANFLVFASDRITRTSDNSRTSGAVALDIYKAFGRISHTDLFKKFSSYRI